MDSELYVLEVSGSQKRFHICKLSQATLKNLQAFYHRLWINDWIPVFVGTWEECSAMADRLEPILGAIRQGVRGVTQDDPIQ